MTVAFPWVLWVTGVAVLGVIAAHLLSVGRPPVLVLPTARFIPDGALESVSRARRLSDLWLLLVRALALLLAGAAFAGVRTAPSRVPVASVAVLDVGNSADTAAWRAAAVQALDGLALDSSQSVRAAVLWDGRVLRGDAGALRAALDTIPMLGPRDADATPTRASHSLAGALLAAQRTAPSLADMVDSLALVVVSPLRDDATSAALRAVRSVWPGRIDVVSPPTIATAPNSTATDSTATLVPARAQVMVRAREGDAVSVAFRQSGTLPAAPTRVVRALPASDDSAFARAGGVLVWWPDSSASASRSRAGEAADSVEARADVGAAVIANGRALVVPLSRTVSFAESQVAVAWWPDGATAVAEEALGTGCVRTVGFAPPGGDVLLSASARGLLSALVAPCATAASPRSSAPLSADMVAALGDSGPLVAADALPSVAERGMPPLARWLLACAVACLALEQWMRARRASAPGGAA